MGRVLRQQAVIEITSGTNMAAPEAPSPYRGQHWTNHTDKRDESYDRIEPPDDDVGDDDPIEVQSRRSKMTMKIHLFLHLLLTVGLLLSRLG